MREIRFEVTSEFKLNLRKADRVAFRYIGEHGDSTMLVLYRRVGDGYLDAVISEHRLPALGRDVYFYSMHKDLSGWDALHRLIKPGDVLHFQVFDNRNQYLEHAVLFRGREDDPTCGEIEYVGLHHDMLYVSISRNGKTWLRQLVLEDSICPDNTARAVKD
jgi:hypothetical protein